MIIISKWKATSLQKKYKDIIQYSNKAKNLQVVVERNIREIYSDQNFRTKMMYYVSNRETY